MVRGLGYSLACVGLLASGCIAGRTPPATPAHCGELTEVTLQLQWYTQAQFAGYYAALDQGFYLEECLDVLVYEAGVEVVPLSLVISGGADYAVSWVPRALIPHEEGAPVAHIAQVFERSGTLQVAWADSGIKSVEDLRGRNRNIGNWGFGNDFELRAGLKLAGIDAARDVVLVQQNYDMSAFLNREIDAAQAMIYNEYAQVLEAVNPATGEQYRPEDIVVIDWNDVGTSMLQDSLWTDSRRLADEEGFLETTKKFIKASLKGWIWCRDNSSRCVDIVLASAPTLGRSHQLWQLNEINALIWPSSAGVGVLAREAWDRTIRIVVEEDILERPPSSDIYRVDLALEVVGELHLEGYDVFGNSWQKEIVELSPGGE